jgi:hypothetical protein
MLPSLFLALSASVILGCSNKLDGDTGDTDRTPPDDTDIPAEDRDGDGSYTPDDCDDDDPTVYPGATELCDGKDNDCDEIIPEEETDKDGNGVVECEEVCDPSAGAGSVPMVSDCEVVPAEAGPFSVKVEWNMSNALTDPATGATLPAYTFADEPEYGAVFQAPAVGFATSDAIPDIAVIMTAVDTTASAVYDGVLRLIAGDGSAVEATVHWDTAGSYDYAPYRYAGVAIGNIDADANVEIATLVFREGSEASPLCYPAVYEVDESSGTVTLSLEKIYTTANYNCSGHAPNIADIDDDGKPEVIYGKAVFNGEDYTQQWYGTGGRGWYGRGDYSAGYWNSGYHSFAYDVDGDGKKMEVVAGKTVYKADGTTYCELGDYSGTTWVPATDGYPSIADISRFSGDSEGEPEIVITGNTRVSIYHGTPDYDPNGKARCLLIDSLPNDPASDPTVASGLPAPTSCNASATSFGGAPTLADFDGDGEVEVGVAGSCWYSVFDIDSDGYLSRYALYNTRDWSSASTGSTVFDFNGDQKAEVVFSDEQALYVWGVDTSSGLKAWERLVPYLIDDSHKSWTVHEYPLVADVDADGKAEIVAVNSFLPKATSADTAYLDRFGIYVLGSADDNWVSARQVWNQHAYYVTNVEDDGAVGFSTPNYAPWADYNSFRQQAPGSFGALQAPNLLVKAADELCQEGCGDVIVEVQVANEGSFITTSADIPLSLYGEKSSGARTLLSSDPVGVEIGPGEITDTYSYLVPASVWTKYARLVAVIDDPEVTGTDHGIANECYESDNEVDIPLTGVCE